MTNINNLRVFNDGEITAQIHKLKEQRAFAAYGDLAIK